MRFAGLFALGAAVVGLGACIAKKPAAPRAPAQATRTLPPCDTVSGIATSASPGTASARAERSLALQLPDARGDLLGSGYRRIRVVGRDQQCGPYKVGGLDTGLVTCVARARVCGRS